MKNAPFEGGWLERGPTLRVDQIAAGHGVSVSASDRRLPRGARSFPVPS